MGQSASANCVSEIFIDPGVTVLTADMLNNGSTCSPSCCGSGYSTTPTLTTNWIPGSDGTATLRAFCDGGTSCTNAEQTCNTIVTYRSSSPSDTPSATPSETPILDSVGGGGDPHYSLQRGELLTTQALCALLLAKSDDLFGLNFEIHARHGQPDKQKEGEEYTFIRNIGMKLGDDIYELHADLGIFSKNGELFDIEAADLAAVGSEVYSIERKYIGQRKNQLRYTFSFVDRSTIVLTANLHYKMSFISMTGAFGGANLEGFLGNPHKKGLLARDGSVMATSAKDVDVEAYTNEWQVLGSELMLFRDKAYFPQLPEHQCQFVDTGHGMLLEGTAGGGNVRAGGFHGENVRRRLLSKDEMSPAEAEKLAFAKKACSHHAKGNPTKMEWCVSDVLATGFADLADEFIYN